MRRAILIEIGRNMRGDVIITGVCAPPKSVGGQTAVRAMEEGSGGKNSSRRPAPTPACTLVEDARWEAGRGESGGDSEGGGKRCRPWGGRR